MYKIYADNHLIHYDLADELKLIEPSLELELNQPGSLKYIVVPNHPLYDKFVKSNDPTRIKRMKSIITVYRENKLVFRGRILEIEDSFYKEKQVTCEGELAFFIDSQLRPYTFEGSPEEIFKYYVDVHNEQMADYPEKQFIVGRVTVTDGESNDENIEVRSSDSIVSVWSEISSKLIESLGGYLVIDEDENGNRRINWLSEDDFLFGTQEIRFGENLLNLKINVKGDEIATALIPVGGEPESESSDEDYVEDEEYIEDEEIVDITTEETTEVKERLTIESLPDGVVMELEDDVIYKKGDYIYSEKGVEEYGLIFATQTWDDITKDKDHLLDVAIKHLNNTKKAIESIEINALDLYKIEDVSAFTLGTKVKVTSKIHGLNGDVFPLTKMSLNLSNPASNSLTLTKIERSFTETSVAVNKTYNEVGNVVERVEKVENNTSGLEEKVNANIATTEQLSSVINQTSEEILTKVSEEYFLKDDANTLIQSVETEFKQTNEAFEMRFNQFNADVENLTKDTNTQFQQINKYIRFIDGKIVLGEEGNELTLNITNDRISFLQDNIEVAYFSNKEFKVVKGEFINQLTLGNFAFIPEEDGGLVFKKIK